MPNKFLPKAVLFDMDGVLLDTEPISRDGWRAAVREQGFELTDEIYNNIVGTNIQSSRERLCAAFGEKFDYEAAKKIRDGYTHGYREKHGVKMKKGVINLLDTLDELEIPACVATSTNMLRALEFLNAQNLAGRFKKIIGGDNVTKGKPDPEIYLKAASVMNTPPEECLAVEDSRLGTESAFRAGIKVIVVPDLQVPDEETRSRAFAVCKDLNEVAQMIRGAK